MSTETEMTITQTIYQAVFVEGLGNLLRTGAWPLKVGDRLIISDARIMVDVPWEPVNKYREKQPLTGQNAWFEGGAEKQVSSKEWIDFVAMLEKESFDCPFDCPNIPQPAGTHGLGWGVLRICDGCHGKGNYAGFVCQDCDGKKRAYEEAEAAQYAVVHDGQNFAARLLWIINQLPNAKLGHCNGLNAVAFTFDGGRGILMPMSE